MRRLLDHKLLAGGGVARYARRMTATLAALLCVVPALALSLRAGEPLLLQADFSRTAGVFRPLHGINKGPLTSGGTVDLTALHRALGVPFNRLHDCHWPNPDVVDIHVVFPDPRADPARAESYDFTLTDEYVAGVLQTGAQIVFRLGESIEHTKTKRFVHPPKDPEQWAAVCLGIIRHYNDGWARGFRHGIRYWEIWNEPENRPQMWTGTDAEFIRLYHVTARAIKTRYPDLFVGGPAFGHSGHLKDGKFEPTAFVTEFLESCRREKVPLDFFSWHCYTDNPAELSVRSRAIRALLDAHGFAKTESHLNEWNYLPGKDWGPLSVAGQGEGRQRFYEQMAGPAGAAFVATALVELQDASLDMGNFYHGEVGAFGLFTEHAVPTKNYHALRAFHDLLATPRRVETRGAVPGQLAVGAGVNEAQDRAAVLVSNFSHPQAEFRLALANLPWTGPTVSEVRLLDAVHNLAVVRRETNSAVALSLTLPRPAVALITLQAAR